MAPSDDRTLSWGFASSPVLFEDTVVIQSDSKKQGFLAAFCCPGWSGALAVAAIIRVSL